MRPARNKERKSPWDEFKWREQINIKLFYDCIPWVLLVQHRSYFDMCASGRLWTPWIASGMIIFVIILLPLYASYITLLLIQRNCSWHWYHSHAKMVFKRGWLIVLFSGRYFYCERHKPSLSYLQSVTLSQLSCNELFYYLHHLRGIY